MKYTAFGLILFQVIMLGLYSAIFGQDLIFGSLILIFGQIFYMVIFRFFDLSELK